MAEVKEKVSEPEMGLNFEKVWAMFQETRKLIEENAKKSEKEMAESRKEMERVSKETRKEIAGYIKEMKDSAKELDIKMGKISNRLGDIIEHIVSPGVLKRFAEDGYNFTNMGPQLYKKDGQFLTQVDLLLANGKYIMAVEIKSKPTIGDVNDHIERMGILRSFFDAAGDKRKLIGAGAVVDDSVRPYVLRNGFYMLEQAGADMKITAPANGQPKEW
jgi:hypothetical protein